MPNMKSSQTSKRSSDANTMAHTEDESTPVPKQLPLLFIDIHLDDKDVHRLTIHDGDSPESLADDFCK